MVFEIRDEWAENKPTPDNRVFLEWLELRRAMKDASSSSGGSGIKSPVMTPGKFLTAIHHVANMKGRELFTGFAQNDLPEFLLFMVECIHNSKKRSVSMKINGTAENNTDHLAFKCYNMLKDTYSRGDYSELSDLFYGVYVSRIVSEDRTVVHALNPESYFMLDLPIPEGARSLYDCLDLFVREEPLTDWVNEDTKRREPVLKNLVFWNFPRVLVITFKRFSNRLQKNSAPIDFPIDELDLSKYVVGYKPGLHKYKLFGVANHTGGVNGGHYTAFGMPEEDRWFHYNDASVREVDDKRRIVSPEAYCLWYRKLAK
jgi:ubiquitin C-terminal hydrolase